MNTEVPTLARKAIAELLGTFVLVCFATGVMISGVVPFMGLALSPALAVFILILTLGYISGAHFNPAVSLAFLLLKQMNLKEFITYVLAQLAGSAIAALSMFVIFSKAKSNVVHSGVNQLAHGTSFLTGFFLELGMTIVFILVVLLASQVRANEPKQLAPFSISIAVFGLLLTFGPLTGACFNPARWFGPALASGFWNNGAIYIFAPMIGSVLGVFTFRYLSSGAGRNPA